MASLLYNKNLVYKSQDELRHKINSLKKLHQQIIINLEINNLMRFKLEAIARVQTVI